MAGAAKKRAQKERSDKQNAGSSQESSGKSGERGSPQSLRGVDGNRDPQMLEGVRRDPTTNEPIMNVRNISEALGIVGWNLYNATTVSLLFYSQSLSSFVPRFCSCSYADALRFCPEPHFVLGATAFHRHSLLASCLLFGLRIPYLIAARMTIWSPHKVSPIIQASCPIITRTCTEA